MKRIFISVFYLLSFSLMVACTPSANQEDFVPKTVLPEQIKDCNFYILNSSSGSIIRVVRCPSKTEKTEFNPISSQIFKNSNYICMNGFINTVVNNSEKNSVTYTKIFDINNSPVACKS